VLEDSIRRCTSHERSSICVVSERQDSRISNYFGEKFGVAKPAGTRLSGPGLVRVTIEAVNCHDTKYLISRFLGQDRIFLDLLYLRIFPAIKLKDSVLVLKRFDH